MLNIYKKINSHLILINDDIKEIVNIRLREMNVYIKKKNVLFTGNKNVELMKYNYKKRLLMINKNYKNIIFEDIIDNKLVENKINNKNFLIDVYNLEVLLSLYHELRHIEQFEIFFSQNNPYYNLIKESINIITSNVTLYYKYYSKFLSEYDAELSAAMSLLNDIEHIENNILDDAIYIFNANIAGFILRSRGYYSDENQLIYDPYINSPISFIELINGGSNKTTIKEYIEYIRKNIYSEYDKLIYGDELSIESIIFLNSIANGEVKTKNIYKFFENNIKKEQQNNIVVKKLCNS